MKIKFSDIFRLFFTEISEELSNSVCIILKEKLTIKLAPAGCGEECNVVVELISFFLKFSVYVEN